MTVFANKPRARPAWRIAAITLAALAAAPSASAERTVLHREASLYHNILVTKELNRICLRFTLRDIERSQSCIDPREPQRMVFAYTRMMMAALLLAPEPARILAVGLGGGTIPTALVDVLPDARVDVVEIDPAVAKMAERYFDFETSARLRLHLVDARPFVKRAVQGSPPPSELYNLVLLDAYSGDYIPEHLMTREFLEETRSLLAPDGVVAANTFSRSRLYDHESETYRAVFGPFFNLKTPASSNRIIVAGIGELPSSAALQRSANALQRRLRPYGIPIREYADRMSLEVDWDTSKEPLTDQYSPANLLRNE